jgi:hypothetical protein
VSINRSLFNSIFSLSFFSTVNSKSGDNQGVKFLRRFKQLLNPAQVFDLIHSGPQLGLRLFRHFDPFRILICSGDGSVGWVLSEIDRLNMHVSLIEDGYKWTPVWAREYWVLKLVAKVVLTFEDDSIH